MICIQNPAMNSKYGCLIDSLETRLIAKLRLILRIIHFYSIKQIFRQIEVTGFDSNQYETDQVFVESKDGTKIPLFIVHKKVDFFLLFLISLLVSSSV